MVDVSTQHPSPFARSMLFGYVAQFMYEGDSPIAERRAAALALDQGLLAELLGRAELRELLDPEVLAEVEAELQRTAPDRRARDAEGVADLLRLLGPLSTAEVAERSVDAADVGAWLAALADRRRVVAVRMGGDERWAAIEDVGRLRDGLGVPVPPGTPDAFTDPVDDPLADLVGRYARTHGPFTTDDVAARLGLGAAVVRHTLQRLAAQGRVLDGEFRPSGSGTEWCDAEVLRRLRRRSLARLRQEIEPVEPETLGRFVPAWQHVGGRHRGVDGVLTVIDQLAGCPVPASALEPLVLAARVRDYEPSYLDELTASGEVVWAGHAPLPGSDGWVSLHLADQAPLTLPDHQPFEHSELHQAVLDALAPGGAWFFRQLSDSVGSTNDATLSTALWDLVWAGRVSNDTLTPLRALTRSGTPAHRTRRPPPRLGRPGVARTGPPETAGRWALLPADRHRPDPPGARHRRAAPRPARRGHPRRGGERAGARRLRRRLQGALRVRGLRPLPARLLRRRPRRGAVRHRRLGRPAADLLRGPARRQARRRRAGRHRPGQPVRRRPPLAASRAATGPAARPARSWCSSTARSRCTSSAAAAPCSPGPTSPTCSARPRRRSRRPPGAARSAG